MINPPILYSFRRCPYAIRARLALLSSGLVCRLREVSLANKPAEMIAASPKATIPVMVLPDGQVWEESLDIMNYALAQNDPENWLTEVTVGDYELVATNDQTFKVHLDGYKYPGPNPAERAMHRQAGLDILRSYEDRLAQNDFLTGPTCKITDIAILPFIRQFAAVDEAWFADQNIPNVQHWLADFLASTMFQAAMATFPVWKTGEVEPLFSARSQSA